MKQSSRHRRAPSDLSDSIHRQLNMYALAAAAAGVGMLALAQAAEAKIIYTKTNKQLPNGYSYLDLNNDKHNDFEFNVVNVIGGSTQILSVGAMSGNLIWGAGGSASALSAGVKVGPDKVHFQPGHDLMGKCALYQTWWGSWSVQCKGPWQNAQNRYLGLKFHIKNKIHYGWARLSVSGVDNATLTGYAYETIVKKAIITGKTKGPDVITVQPASLGHLARGASAIANWRGKQVSAAAH